MLGHFLIHRCGWPCQSLLLLWLAVADVHAHHGSLVLIGLHAHHDVLHHLLLLLIVNVLTSGVGLLALENVVGVHHHLHEHVWVVAHLTWHLPVVHHLGPLLLAAHLESIAVDRRQWH